VLKLGGRRRPASLTPDEQKIFDAPWQFSYSPIDLQTGPQPENKERYQIEAQAFVFRHIRDALISARKHPSGLVPTMGDGFYGIYSLERGARSAHIVNIGSYKQQCNPVHFEQTKLAAKLLGVQDRCTFDTLSYDRIEGNYDFCILADCANQFPDPLPLLTKLKEVVNGPLVLFSTTILRHKVPLVYDVPAAHRPWGSAFSHDRLLTFAVDAGWTVVNEQYKRLPQDWQGEQNMSCFLCM
jgi:hypothetical protein